MSSPLYVDPAIALRAAGTARDHSSTVLSYLDAVDRDVEDLLATWKGDSAKAYSENWDDLLELLRLMGAELDRLGVQLDAGTQSFVRVDSV